MLETRHRRDDDREREREGERDHVYDFQKRGSIMRHATTIQWQKNLKHLEKNNPAAHHR